MNCKIISDSSSNVFTLEGVPYTTVPMKIIAGDKEYVDTSRLDLAGMVSDLKSHKGKSGSSCPNVQEWLDAFEGSDTVFGVTISRNLSGSYNAAQEALQEYLQQHPDARGYIFDSQSAGPEQMMVAVKAAELAGQGLDFDAICQQVLHYHDHLHTIFCLESLTNLARNGRVSPAVATVAGVLGIRVVGSAKGGQLAPAHKPRGEKKALQTVFDMMLSRGLYDGALVRIAHCYAPQQAQALKEKILSQFPNCRFILEATTALCSYYAEAGGLIIGFEGSYNEENNQNS